jgi:hypothetical protein
MIAAFAPTKSAVVGACYIIPGISSIWASVACYQRPKRESNQCLTGQFPTRPNREFFDALQGIKSSDQGTFHRDQGIPLSSAIWPFAWVTEDRCAYRRPGALPVNPARRNASAIASPLAGTELLGPARVSAGRRRLSDPPGATSALAVVGRASGA